MLRQILTLQFDGLTAGDYLAHVCDPDTAAYGLRSVTVRAEPLGTTLEATLLWDGAAPDPCTAARAAGLPYVAEVVALEAREADAVRTLRAA